MTMTYARFTVAYWCVLLAVLLPYACAWLAKSQGFGKPRSHGCINLAPRDAQTIFGKTLPALPSGWHGMAPGRGGLGQGTMVVIRG